MRASTLIENDPPSQETTPTLYGLWQGDPRALGRARGLRRRATDAENALWKRLRNRSLGEAKFRRQQPLGPYTVDFLCFEQRLVVEVDGGQHAEQVDYDAERTMWLEAQGFRVLRFWNSEVLQEIDGVLSVIMEALNRPEEEERESRTFSTGDKIVSRGPSPLPGGED